MGLQIVDRVLLFLIEDGIGTILLFAGSEAETQLWQGEGGAGSYRNL